MITGFVRLYNSDLVLDDCMVTGSDFFATLLSWVVVFGFKNYNFALRGGGSLQLLGSSRVLLRRGMLTGSVETLVYWPNNMSIAGSVTAKCIFCIVKGSLVRNFRSYEQLDSSVKRQSNQEVAHN